MPRARPLVPYPTQVNRSHFPKDFLFGTASSAYQYEGAVDEDDRGDSLWDAYTEKHPAQTGHSDGTLAVDFYHRYKEDIQRMKELNLNAFRFSIAWTRILPDGKLSKGVNEEGIEFYDDLINELLENGITPLVTLFHWDIPLDLEDEYGGFLSEKVVGDFVDYARVCFDAFGDRVKHWITLNEPYVYSVAGYDTGKKAPGRGSKYVNPACEAGQSGHEVYIVTHNLLLAHAAVVEEFRKHPKCKDGKIGIAHNPAWFEPYDPKSQADREAAARALEFMFDWHQYPTTFGDYPEVMKQRVGDRLPSFTPEQSEKLKNSYDFVGINYYASLYAAPSDFRHPEGPAFLTDTATVWRKRDVNGNLIGKQGGLEFMLVYPQGLRELLNYIKNKYNNPKIIITENGYGDIPDHESYLVHCLNDFDRLEYHAKHIENLHKAIDEDGVQVEGYFAWSLLDNFEWQEGYSVRFGLYYIDYKDGLKRHPKMSALWFKEFLKGQPLGDKHHHETHHGSKPEKHHGSKSHKHHG